MKSLTVEHPQALELEAKLLILKQKIDKEIENLMFADDKSSAMAANARIDGLWAKHDRLCLELGISNGHNVAVLYEKVKQKPILFIDFESGGLWLENEEVVLDGVFRRSRSLILCAINLRRCFAELDLRKEEFTTEEFSEVTGIHRVTLSRWKKARILVPKVSGKQRSRASFVL